jgi:hypothetical protein
MLDRMFKRNPGSSSTHPPKALVKNPTYENFRALCPTCNRWNVFNRASDIGSFELVSNATVTCEYSDCGQTFTIGGDWINPGWQMLILDCEDLKAQKHYAYCILNLAQAFEMFFALYLRVQFLYKPYASEKPDHLEGFNRCSGLLYETTRKHAYAKMRNIFVNLLLRRPSFGTLAESETAITGLLASLANEPSDNDIRGLGDAKLADVLMRLKKSTVSDLRNDVVHKQGYRPTINEVCSAIDETTGILYALNRQLGQPADSMYFYEATTPTA